MRLRFSFLLVGLIAGMVRADEVPGIPSVSTWGELAAAPALAIQDPPEETALLPIAAPHKPGRPPFRIRVGIDRHHVTAPGGVLLYCLAEGLAINSTNDRKLGPFEVRVHAKNSSMQVAAMADRQMTQVLADTRYTFAAQVADIPGVGTWEVELWERIKNPPRDVLRARTEVIAATSRAPYHAWSPWDEGNLANVNADPSTPDQTNLAVTVANPEGGWFLPSLPTQSVALPELPPASRSLPVLIPEKPNPNFHLKLAADGFEATLPGQGVVEDAEDDFLTRWWVNDKPVQLKSDAPFMQHARQEAATFAISATGTTLILFHVDFWPERLRVKKGDRVTVQLLFCPHGFTPLGPLVQLEQAMQALPPIPPADFPPCLLETLQSRRVHLLRQSAEAVVSP